MTVVINFDKIAVLDDGKIVEYGDPKSLLAKSVLSGGAWFRRMVEEMEIEREDSL